MGSPQGAFEPFFQPQISFPAAELAGLEALAWWKQDDGSNAPAASFIKVANETGLITEIGKAILGRSLDVLGALARCGVVDPAFSINLSSTQLGNETAVEGLLDACFVRDVSAVQINIELLESTLFDERANQIGRNIKALSKAGFRIKLDDFGPGHTALASLTLFSMHQIKVDRSLIKGIDQDPKKRAIAGGLSLVCKKLGSKTSQKVSRQQRNCEYCRTSDLRTSKGITLQNPCPRGILSSGLARAQEMWADQSDMWRSE